MFTWWELRRCHCDVRKAICALGPSTGLPGPVELHEELKAGHPAGYPCVNIISDSEHMCEGGGNIT